MFAPSAGFMAESRLISIEGAKLEESCQENIIYNSIIILLLYIIIYINLPNAGTTQLLGP